MSAAIIVIYICVFCFTSLDTKMCFCYDLILLSSAQGNNTVEGRLRWVAQQSWVTKLAQLPSGYVNLSR